ncbi:Hypothetical protein KNT65_gp164 [Escherichia phage EcS1]|uniref:Anti-restriction nuclease n=1 Tax=Escherichia phage EcS1 TaxID=2083276 RepID=A0A2Z5ZCF2_9CAUD|nr:Hypothetical protein KNT65_gp164 [Escherichia phage EcS1]BBC78329.1 Hypothetical protein [Escherichia phage EcS1]
MNKLEIINELRRCAETRIDKWGDKVWDIWYKGEYLGEITRMKNLDNSYACIRSTKCDSLIGRRDNFMAAISSFVSGAIKIHNEKLTIVMREALNNTPDIKQIGIREPKSMWQKIKGWFK